MDFPLSADYHKWRPEKYTRGLFFDTVCTEGLIPEVYNYEGMLEKLAALAEGPNDAELVSVGKTPGYGSRDNALDIWSLQLPATVEPKYTLFLVAGHHYEEASGPLVVYELASRILDADMEDNMNVKLLRESVHIVCIPQVDSDAYAHLWNAFMMEPEEFYQEAYERYLDPAIDEDVLDWNRMVIQDDFRNYYLFLADGVPEAGADVMFPLHDSVKMGIDKVIAAHGRPTLAIDFHESSGIPFFFCMQMQPPDEKWSLINAEVGKYHFAAPDLFARWVEWNFPKDENRGLSFGDYMKYLNAESYVIESPDAYADKAVEMGIIATDCILALHLWGLLDSE